METVLEWVIVGLLGVAGVVWALIKVFGETTAEEIAKEVVAEMTRDARLARELEEVRGTQRQEFRIKSYSALWATMDPLAIYEDKKVDPDSMRLLSEELTNWYFNQAGGLMLTSAARSFYFALQDLVRSVSRMPGWEAIRSPDDPRERLRAHFVAKSKQDLEPGKLSQLDAAFEVFDMLEQINTREWPPEGIEARAKGWRGAVGLLVEDWLTIEPKDQFAVLQQVSSVLRTVLTADVESRIR